MLIVCPSCASEYTIDAEKLGADGRTVRCAICRDTWFVRPAFAASPNVSTEAAAEAEPHRSERLPPTPAPKRRRPFAASLAAAAFLVLTALGGLAWHGSALEGSLGSWPRPSVASGLAFENVTAALTETGEDTFLVVAGDIHNRADREIDLPHLAILVRNEDEKVLATWTDAPPESVLGPGQTLRFATRLSSPPPDGRQVRVQFTKAGGIAVAVSSPAH